MMEMFNPSYKFQYETRKRLSKYEVLDLYNVVSDFYSLKYVQLDPVDVERNPFLKRSRDILENENSLEA